MLENINIPTLYGSHRSLPAVDFRRSDIALLESLNRNGGLRPAARDVLVDPASAGRRLDTLARRFGGPLLSYKHGRARLTTGGWLLYRFGHQFIDVIDHAMDCAAPNQAAASMLVPTLTMSTALDGREWFMDLLSSYLGGIVVDLRTAEDSDFCSFFDHYDVDVACGWDLPLPDRSPAVDGAETVRRPAQCVSLLSEKLWIAVPSDHPLAGDSALSLSDLTQQTWALSPNRPERIVLEKIFGHQSLSPAAILPVPSSTVQRSLVAQGRAIALMSPLAAPRYDTAGFRLRPILDGPSLELVLAVDPFIVPAPVAQRLSQAIRSHYAGLAKMHPEYRYGRSFPPHADVPEPVNPFSSVPQLDEILMKRIEMITPAKSHPPGRNRFLLEPEHLTVLETIHQAGSVSRAASALRVTQPALTRRLRRLEERINITLLHASPGGTTLSDSAHTLLAQTVSARDAMSFILTRQRHPDIGWAPHLVGPDYSAAIKPDHLVNNLITAGP